mmetsp:Transcript_14972/g.60091  ORF Transcript_14972/g.60091 Transcript_14972/m.60091 type:complete len:179 (-) Transcript_14972:175-711(-)
MLQVVVRVPEAKMHLLPSITKAAPEELPTTASGAIVLCGSLDGVSSPATPDSWPNAVFLRVRGSKTIDLPEEYAHGMCVALYGAGTICGEPVAADDPDGPHVCVFGKGRTLEFQGDDLDVFVAAGEPMLDQPWVKKLGANGFGVFRNEHDATDIMAKAVAAGPNWTYKILDDAEIKAA